MRVGLGFESFIINKHQIRGISTGKDWELKRGILEVKEVKVNDRLKYGDDIIVVLGVNENKIKCRLMVNDSSRFINVDAGSVFTLQERYFPEV
jgi:hypothetical protein